MFKSKVNNSGECSYIWLKNKKIVFIGDSITADKISNYVTLTLNKLAEQIDVTSVKFANYGMDSFSIHDALDIIPEIMIEENPDVFIILIGVNDSKIFRHLNRPLIAPNIFKDSYASLLNRIDATGGSRYKVLVTLPALLFEEIELGDLLSEYWYWKPTQYLEYIKVIRDFGKREKCMIADVFESFKLEQSEGNRLFYDDGVHPNIYGHRIIAEEVVKALAKFAKH
ncbi:MAG: SGNH/GDSL hydrolase family protein [candidate division Zixibacteria bacterium]|nr:SGNH/GDSL hydrolase family protein [candidate division Zixibacteria bacterium]